MAYSDPHAKRSLGELLGTVPKLVVNLISTELQHLKAEMSGKLASLGIGVGLFAAVAFLGVFLFGVLLAAAILGLSVVFAPWLSALIVAGVLLIIMIVLALVGLSKVKKATPLVPTETIESIKEDIRAVKGMGVYDLGVTGNGGAARAKAATAAASAHTDRHTDRSAGEEHR